MISFESVIRKFHQFFDTNYSAFITRSKTVADPSDLLIDSYFAADGPIFKKFMKDKQDKYFYNKAQIQNLTHDGLPSYIQHLSTM